MKFDGEFTLTVDGKATMARSTVDVINPATGEAFAKAPAADGAILDRAVALAHEAFLSWRSTSWDERSRLLIALADAIEAKADVFG